MRVFMIAIWVVMVTMTGYALFNISYQVEALEGQLTDLNQQIDAEKENVHNLNAEWSYATRPDWLASLGDDLMPEFERLTPQQVLQIEDIPFRRLDVPEAEAVGFENALPLYPDLRATDILYPPSNWEVTE